MTASEDNENGVSSAFFRNDKDVYIIYSYEDVAFHWNYKDCSVKRRFKGTSRESHTDESNRLFLDARMGGRVATREEYEKF